MRNHGFLLDPGNGWRLAPAYDMNPVSTMPFANAGTRGVECGLLADQGGDLR